MDNITQEKGCGFIKIFINKHDNGFKTALSLVVGFSVFLLTANLTILNPQNSAWLMASDPAQNFLGWQFFRTAPFFQWPFGANPNYGMGISGSIVYSDSVPLIAFLLKPVSSYLPAVFQYLGIWIFICFLLQSYFAWKLLSKFTRDAWLPLIGCAYFAIAPFLLWRLFGHYALFGQWVILAAFCLYFRGKYSPSRWILLLGVTALIHAYLLAMISAIWLADMAQRLLIKEKSFSRIFIGFIIGAISTAFVMWFAGYFMLGNDVMVGGFGFYRMNLLSLINPDKNTLWSEIFRDQNLGGGDFDGFNFLGSGIIILAVIALYECAKNKRITFNSKVIPLCLISLLFFVFAVSNRVAIGSLELFSYPVPSFMRIITGTFRAPGRFFWPVSYLIYLSVFYLIFTSMKRRAALLLLVLLLIIQIADSSRAFAYFRDKFRKNGPYVSFLRSPDWDIIAGKYKKVILVQPGNGCADWVALCDFAVYHHMAINTGCFSRVDDKKLQLDRIKLAEEVIDGNLDPEALYFFENDALWNFVSVRLKKTDLAGVKDGFRFVAPGFIKTAGLDFGKIKFIVPPPASNFKYVIKDKIYFAAKGSSNKYRVFGWSEPEAWGDWSDEDSAAVIFYLADVPGRDLILQIESQAFLPEKHFSQEVEVYFKGRYLDTLKFTPADNGGIRSVRIPKELISKEDPYVLIEFRFKGLRSPSELGLSSDIRRLGLAVIAMRLIRA